MKTKSIIITSFFMFSLFILTSMATSQDTKTFEGVYDGHEDYGYNFIGKNLDSEEYTMTFHNVDEILLKSIDLKSDKLIGTKFKVLYTTKVEKVKDDDGYEDEVETHTIIALDKL